MRADEAEALAEVYGSNLGWIPGLAGNGAPIVRPVVLGRALYSPGTWEALPPGARVYGTPAEAREAARTQARM